VLLLRRWETMAMLSGFCSKGHPVEAFIASDDIRRDGENGVIAVTGVEDVTCGRCGALIAAIAEEPHTR
jgi:hypothetical protein